MAKTKKRKSTTAKFNMAEEIRSVLKSNKQASNKDVFAALEKKFGKGSFNEASCGVAVSNQRKALGLSKGRKIKKKRPAATGSPRPVGRPAASSISVSLDALRAAKSLLSAVNGDSDAAVSAIRQLKSLQVLG